MKRFDKGELVAFVRAVDRHLTSQVEIVVIDGAAAALGYDSNTRTSDIDVYSVRGSEGALGEAAELARQETGLGVSVGGTGVADLPHNYESRLKSIRGLHLHNLIIIVPDKYDLALSKTVRGYPHDIDAIEGMNEQHHLAQKTLVDRFETELFHQAIADKRKLALNMAMVVARLYGFEDGKKLAARWGVPVPS